MHISYQTGWRPSAISFAVIPKPFLSSNGIKDKCWRIRASSLPLAIDPDIGFDTELDGFEQFLLGLQGELVEKAEVLNGDAARFRVDRWSRGTGSFGATCVLEEGSLLEKAAVNVTIGSGNLTPERAAAMSSRGRNLDPKGGQEYSAAALSLVFHSAHPFVPTLRADIRRFKVDGMCWFGGGADLTPFYVFEEDFIKFHKHWEAICGGYSGKIYKEFKKWCDDYFYLPAREEHRGIGGLFFDDLDPSQNGYDVEEFVKAIGSSLSDSWSGIAQQRRTQEFGQNERQWQLLRRGRYLEFNLLYDRGVKFGLNGGRIEAIMVSAPPLVSWKYMANPVDGSPEADLVEVLKAPKDWATMPLYTTK